jgi:hypothetical protein
MFWVTMPSGIGCSIENRLGEQVRSQKVYNKNRKSRDNTTVNFDRLTWDVSIDRMYSNIISKMGFSKIFLRKSPILAPMPSNWYTDHAPAVWHSERSVKSWQAARKMPQAAAASERKL